MRADWHSGRVSLMRIKGFTLIELLVVIVIIGILATISVATFSGYFERARTAKLEAETETLVRAVIMGRELKGKALRFITGTGCSDCSCRGGIELNNLDETHACIVRMHLTFDRIAEAGQTDLGTFFEDPWGSPYLIDENEQETGCTRDNLRSAGPDAILLTADDISLDVLPFFNRADCGV